MIIAMDCFDLEDFRENWRGLEKITSARDSEGDVVLFCDVPGVSNMWAYEGSVLHILERDGKLKEPLSRFDVVNAICEWHNS